MARTHVRHTREFDRIAALPRRMVDIEADGAAWSDVLTPMMAIPGRGGRLLPAQALALAEALEAGGLWGALPVGAGKTLLSMLLPRMLEAQRPVLVTPAAMRAKTWADFGALRGQWRYPTATIELVSMELLSTEGAADLLGRLDPDLIMIDECDELANFGAAAPQRIDRHVEANRDRLRVCCFSGTPGRNSILDYWHHLRWCLGDGAPVPADREEAELWAAALDHKKNGVVGPGPLGPTRPAALRWYAKRLAETPGVLIVDGDTCAAPLEIRIVPAREDPILDAAFKAFLVDQENPRGIPVSDPLSRFRLDAELGCGVVSYWDPPPPEEWRQARRAACALVRATIEVSRTWAKPLDTERQVFRHHADHPVVKRWLAIKPAFAGATKIEWLSTSAVECAVERLETAGSPGILWCGSVEVGRTIARIAGVPYYGPQGRTDDGRELFAADPTRSLVSSWQANKKGFNLQAWGWQRVVWPPQSAKWLEQMFGRSHRRGRRDAVIVEIQAGSGGTIDAFDSAVAEAEFGARTFGLTGKLLRASIVRPSIKTTPANKYRWATRQKKDH